MRNRKIKNLFIILFAIVAAACFAFALMLTGSGAALAATTVSDGEVRLGERQYGAKDKFVLTAAANFDRGNEAGLVFGAKNSSEYYSFSVNRAENSVKVTYFKEGEEPLVLLEDYFIGNDKMTDGEKEMVNPKVANLSKVRLKVIITPEDDKAFAEFYADNIRRFAFDEKGDDVITDLNAIAAAGYAGGYTGFTCADARVSFDEVYEGDSDYSYYSELYRQQYHFSQPAHWNNDPNGLVYFNGYYHLYYQHYPFANTWGDMYWGHARSKDLLHWENLPICLYPDKNFDGRGGDGYMWSGSAMVYRAGTSAKIDELGWFENGDGDGLLGFYTRDGERQDQVLMSSDDGGITWTKRKLIRQDLVGIADRKVDCRDPKVFPVEYDGEKVTRWGMALTGMASNDIWFLQSTNLYDWEFGGGFKAAKPECPDLVTLRADDDTLHTVMTFTARQYLVGELSYKDGKIVFSDLTGKSFADMSIDEIPFQNMDFGPDSYATQSFCIDDEASEYFGKTIALSWFSGVPGHEASIDSGILASVRKEWNGGGMTIPVEYGLAKDGDGYILTQTPIVKNSKNLVKSSIYAGQTVEVNPQSDNILSAVNTQNFELDATVSNPDNVPVRFRINMNGEEYTEVGWNAEEGYYVDRTHTGNAGLNLSNYGRRYTSGARSAGEQTFYILSDNGSVEVYCDNFKIPFYVLTFSSPYAKKAQFVADGAVTASVTVNGIASVWRDENAVGTILQIDRQEITLDRTLENETAIMAYATDGGEITWSVESGSAVSVEKTATGAKIKAVSAGAATVAVTSGSEVKRISVTVYDGAADSDVAFAPTGKISGNWYVDKTGIIGVQSSGDGFILSSKSAGDFTYAANFSLDGAAAAIVFRATADMSDYLIANYDNPGRIVKLWSPRGEIGRCSVGEVDVSDILLKVEAAGDSVKVYFNGRLVIDAILAASEPRDGLFGLNACAARVVFKSVALPQTAYTYNGGDSLEIKSEAAQTVRSLYNRTAGNVLVPSTFYEANGRTLTISKEYFTTLNKAGSYRFVLSGSRFTTEFTVTVSALPSSTIENLNLEYGSNAVVYVGNADVSGAKLNGAPMSAGDYAVKNGVLTIYADKLSVGENTVTLQSGAEFKITVGSPKITEIETKDEAATTTVIIVCSTVGGVLVLGAAAAVTAILLIRRKKKNGGND